MSIGIGGWATAVLQDEHTVIYKYGGYDLNVSGYENPKHICDGLITISKACFPEPEIHEKRKRKKLIVKRVSVNFEIDSLIKSGDIIIDNCSNCLKTDDNGTDITANKILFKLFNLYQEQGKIPECVSFHV